MTAHRSIAELARRVAGLRIRDNDLETLLQWVEDRARSVAPAEIEDYARLLAADSADGQRERELLTARFTTGETYFFRDQGQFDLLAQTILPDLIERRRAERSLRIWSCGCATGEETYSLAMLVDELAPQLPGWNILILGTDIDSTAIARARRGSYGQWSFRALDAARKQRYFEARHDRWQINARLQGMVSFRRSDLLRERIPDAATDLHEMDLIVCRNVFIYLEPDVAARIAGKFADTLAQGGYLMTGHGELFGHPLGALRTRVFPASVVFHKSVQPESPRMSAPTPPRPIIRAAANAGARKERAIEPPLDPAAPPLQPSREDIEALMNSAWCDANRGARDAAERTCRTAAALAAFDPRPYYLLAQLAQERGGEEQTKALLKKVIYLDPSFIAAYLELGALYACEGDAERARKMYRTARAELIKLPAQTTLAPYGGSTAAEILLYVERLLGLAAAPAAVEAAGAAR